MKSEKIKEMLGTLGYSDEYFSKNYSVQIDGTSAIKYDYVAFGDRYLKDVSTSCIAVKEVHESDNEEECLNAAKYLAVPIVLISKNSRVYVWNVLPEKNNLLCDDEDRIIHLYFEKNRFEFMSDALISAKMGYRQLTIFEAYGLIDFSREATCKILSEEFEKGLVTAKKYLQTKKNVNGQSLNNVTSITMHIISALIINSKMNVNEPVLNILDLIDKLSKDYEDYFNDKIMFKYGKELVCKIYESLNPSINYQSVDHELLGYFYETTLFQFDEKRTKSIRKQYGIYYTPKILGQEIVQSIPFEMIPVDKRYVLDGTCGSGSLLLSACKRLADLVSYEKTGFDEHEYLTNMIEGFDVDKFAAEVAKLSLLLYSLPYGNKWNVRVGNLLRMSKQIVQTPFVILGNPPYEERRKNGQKSQKATRFLDKYFDWLHDGGYMGIILPESFLQNDSCVCQREKLLNKFDILELWTLPGQIFANNCSTVVLIAQKKKLQDENLTKIKMLTRNNKNIDVSKYEWDFQFFVDIQKQWKNRKKFRMGVSPAEDIIQKFMTDQKTLGGMTRTISGIKMPADFEYSKRKFGESVPYIVNAKYFSKYVISQEMRTHIMYFDYHMSCEDEKSLKSNYPGLRLRRSYEDIYSARNKVLIKFNSTPADINCISAVVDEYGYYPSDSFFAVISSDSKISNYVICALINSKLINLFVRKECVKRTLTTDVLRSIPIPEFTNQQISDIEKFYFEIKESCILDDKERLKNIEHKIDKIIFDAFGLQDSDCERIDKIFAIYNGEGDNVATSDDKLKYYQNVSGEVEDINISRMYCTVCLAEFGEQQIEIDNSMPGWFLRKGAEFSAKYGDGKLFDIKPLVFSYLSDKEVIDLLDEAFVK